MFNALQFRELIIRRTLEYLDPLISYSQEAEDLLFMTAAHESHLGTYLKQVKGPALGVYQMEPATHKDIWGNYLVPRDVATQATIYGAVLNLSHPSRLDDKFDLDDYGAEELIDNLAYATAMARVHYYRVPEAIPKKSDYPNTGLYLIALGEYAKKYYNTELGKARAQDYTDAYLRCGGRDSNQ